MTDAGVYVFGIVMADHPCHVEGLSGVGVPGAAIWRIAAGNTAAAVSAAPAQLRAKRRHLLTHQEVLQRLWEQGPVLPMRFGVIAPDQETLRAELTSSAPRHIEALKQVEGCAEVNVKALQNDELLVEQAATDPDVRRLIANGNYLDRLRLGEAVAAAIARKATADASAMVQDLAPLAVRAVAGPPVQGCAMNSSFLVGMAQMPVFLNRVVQVQAGLGAHYTLRVSGPMPPYSFTG